MQQPNFVLWEQRNVDTTTLEHQLTTMWADLRLQGCEAAVRTHLFNLVVFTSGREVADRLCSRLAELPRRHPSRTIVFVADRLHPESSVDAELMVRCGSSHEPGSGLCEERVMLTAHGRPADHPASVIMPLLLADLPTYLWWPGQPPFGHRMFHRLLNLANQLVVDSAEFSSPGDGLSAISSVCHQARGVNDFNWARLTPWRELIAQFFDGPTHLPYVLGIEKVRVEFGAGQGDAGRAAAGTLLLLGWIASRLGWEPETTLDRPVSGDVTLAVLQKERLIPIELYFCEHGQHAAGRLMGVEITARTGEDTGTFSLMRLSDLAHVEVTTRMSNENEIKRVVPLGIDTDEQLLAAELEMSGRDPLYESVVREAGRMAGREVLLPV